MRSDAIGVEARGGRDAPRVIGRDSTSMMRARAPCADAAGAPRHLPLDEKARDDVLRSHHAIPIFATRALMKGMNRGAAWHVVEAFVQLVEQQSGWSCRATERVTAG